jgi:hypothetical protein
MRRARRIFIGASDSGRDRCRSSSAFRGLVAQAALQTLNQSVPAIKRRIVVACTSHGRSPIHFVRAAGRCESMMGPRLA